jgi:hydroxyquinol 1,2-dioxygenase
LTTIRSLDPELGEMQRSAMPIDLTEDTITSAVQRTFDEAADERFKTVFSSLIEHLHRFARDIRLTPEEWFVAIDFIERAGRISTPTRQEIVLLSDILGLSTLLDRINNHHASSTTDSALLGPFYVEERPRVENGSDISGGVSGTPFFVSGRVIDEHGYPVSGARVDTWHCDGDGFYDVQRADELHDRLAMRALLTTDDDGRFWYRSIVPRYYPVPTDGPCGEILRAANRSPMRPQHTHFRINAQGYPPLITQVFRDDDPYIEQDAVFASQKSLCAEYVLHEPGTAPDGSIVDEPFRTLEWTFVLSDGANGWAAPT